MTPSILTELQLHLLFFYESDTVTLTLREENSLRVFENRVLRKTFALPEGRSNTRVEKTTRGD